MEQFSTTLRRFNKQIEQLTKNTNAMEAITQQTQDDCAEQHAVTEHVANAMSSMASSTQEMTSIAASTAESSQKTSASTEQLLSLASEIIQSVNEINAQLRKFVH